MNFHGNPTNETVSSSLSPSRESLVSRPHVRGTNAFPIIFPRRVLSFQCALHADTRGYLNRQVVRGNRRWTCKMQSTRQKGSVVSLLCVCVCVCVCTCLVVHFQLKTKPRGCQSGSRVLQDRFECPFRWILRTRSIFLSFFVRASDFYVTDLPEWEGSVQSKANGDRDKFQRRSCTCIITLGVVFVKNIRRWRGDNFDENYDKCVCLWIFKLHIFLFFFYVHTRSKTSMCTCIFYVKEQSGWSSFSSS